MSEFSRSWTESNEIKSADLEIPVRQVYVWLLTTDGQTVIVSKDGEKWQLPGGKPEPGEVLEKATAREVFEETGFDITPYQNQLELFGYYTVNEPTAVPATYLQLRYLLNLPLGSDALDLRVDREDNGQPTEDVIRHVGAVSIHDVASAIPWMPTTDEYHYLTNAHIINAA